MTARITTSSSSPTTAAATTPARPGTWRPTCGPPSSRCPTSVEDVVNAVHVRRRARPAHRRPGHRPRRLRARDRSTERCSSTCARCAASRSTPPTAAPGSRPARYWEDVVIPATEQGLTALHGSSPNVGVVGYSLGGGIGWLARKHGLSAESVLAVELVTADGAVVRADRTQNTDLFWALRGGGGGLGVVVAVEIALYEVEELVAGMMMWPWERSAEVLTRYVEWAETAPDSVSASARLLQIPPLPEIPEVVPRPAARRHRRRRARHARRRRTRSSRRCASSGRRSTRSVRHRRSR